MLVQDGTLKVGDPFFSGATWGRVRAMTDERGKRIKEAGPATPVQVTGFDDVPNAGDSLAVVDDETQARMIGQIRQEKAREIAQQKVGRMSLDQLFQRMQQGDVKELNLIVKADVQGSVEVLSETLRKLSTRRGQGQRDPLLGGRDLDQRRAPGHGLGRDRRRLQRPPRAQRRRAGREGRRRHPPLHGHLQPGRRDASRP